MNYPRKIPTQKTPSNRKKKLPLDGFDDFLSACKVVSGTKNPQKEEPAKVEKEEDDEGQEDQNEIFDTLESDGLFDDDYRWLKYKGKTKKVKIDPGSVAKKDMLGVIRYLDLNRAGMPDAAEETKIIKDSLSRVRSPEHQAILDEYFPGFVYLKTEKLKNTYKKSLIAFIRQTEVTRISNFAQNAKLSESFACDFSFIMEKKEPHPNLKTSFRFSIEEQLRQGLGGKVFELSEIPGILRHIKEHYSCDMKESKILIAIFDYFAELPSDEVFSALASFIIIKKTDPKLFMTLERSYSSGILELSYHSHFAFVSHSSIPVKQGLSQYAEIPMNMCVYVAQVPGTLASRKEGVHRGDQELINEGILRYVSRYKGGSKAPNFIMSFDSVIDQPPLMRIEISFKRGERKISKRPCRYNKQFRLSDVISQLSAAYSSEFIEISILGCMAFEQLEDQMESVLFASSEQAFASISDQSLANSSLEAASTMLQVPEGVGGVFLPLKFIDAPVQESNLTIAELLGIFRVDPNSAIYQALLARQGQLAVEIGDEISHFHNASSLKEKKDIEDYVQSMIDVDPFDTRITQRTWDRVIASFKDGTPVTLGEQGEFSRAWNFRADCLKLF